MAAERPAPDMWAPPVPGGVDARRPAGGVALAVRDDSPGPGGPPPVRVRLPEVLSLAGLVGVFLAWAGVWFFAVTVVKFTALNAFP